MAVVGKKFVKVMRAFYFGGKVQPVGSIVELPAVFAVEMVSTNKAVYTEAQLAVAPKEDDEQKPFVIERKSNAR